MKQGVNVMLFFICAFVLFVGTTFWFVWSENSIARQAKNLAASAINHADKFEEKIAELKSVDIYTAKHLDETRQILDKMSKRIEWAEMKASVPTTKIVQAPQTSPLKVEPITVNVVYRRPAKKLDDKAVKTKVIKSVRDKMKSVNQ